MEESLLSALVSIRTQHLRHLLETFSLTNSNGSGSQFEMGEIGGIQRSSLAQLILYENLVKEIENCLEIVKNLKKNRMRTLKPEDDPLKDQNLLSQIRLLEDKLDFCT